MIYIDDRISDLDLTAALAAVSAERRAYALHYRKPVDQRLCLSAYLLLQRALRLEFGIEQVPPFIYGTHGKPALEGYPDIHFNISHCDLAVAVAVALHPVGIDVESLIGCEQDLLERTMNPNERRLIAESSQPEVTFTRLWTMKESFLKLSGNGLTDNLYTVLDNTDNIQFHTIINPRYVVTLSHYKRNPDE